MVRRRSKPKSGRVRTAASGRKRTKITSPKADAPRSAKSSARLKKAAKQPKTKNAPVAPRKRKTRIGTKSKTVGTKSKTVAPKSKTVAPKAKTVARAKPDPSSSPKAIRKRAKTGHDSSPALEPHRRKRPTVREERPVIGAQQPSSMDEALGWMANVDAPKAQQRIGPATSKTRRIKRKTPSEPTPQERAARKAKAERRETVERKRAARTQRIEAPVEENAFSWMDELAGPFSEGVQLDPCEPDQRRGQPAPPPRMIPATPRGQTRRLPREAKAETKKVPRPKQTKRREQAPRRAPTRRVERPVEAKQPLARPPTRRSAAPPRPAPVPQAPPQQRAARPSQPRQHPTAQWGSASSGVRQKLPRQRPPSSSVAAPAAREHLGDRPITAELSESEIRMLGLPPEVALRAPAQPRRQPRSEPRPSSPPTPPTPTESLDEPLERTLDRLANSLDPGPQARRALLEISDSGPVIVDPTRPRSSSEMRKALRLAPFEAAVIAPAPSEAPTRKNLPAVSPASMGYESSLWEQSSLIVDDPFENDPFEDEYPLPSDSSLYELEDPYLLAAIDPSASNPFEEPVLANRSPKPVFPDPPEYKAPGCGDPFCLDPNCGGDPFAFQVRVAEVETQRPLPPVTDRRRRLRRGA